MRRTYTLFAIIALSLFIGYTAGKEDPGLLAFGRRHAVVETEAPGKVIPLGMTVGVRINTDGVMVLGTGDFAGEDGQRHSPAEGVLHAGDLIITINGEPVNDKEDLERRLTESEGQVIFTLRRDGKETNVTVTPETAAKDGVRRIGAWVRDSTKGIGTLTFVDPETLVFGALGHGIMDVDTKQMLSVHSGVIMSSKVTSVKRGFRGTPGELEGVVQPDSVLGTVTDNTAAGIFGQLDNTAFGNIAAKPIPTAGRAQINVGAATLLTNAVDNTLREFAIKIENINRFATDETKSMVIRITDPDLLAVTGGIVQGMSGSPILQNGRIVGAVTHVFVQDPAKGYAIFIENMLR